MCSVTTVGSVGSKQRKVERCFKPSYGLATKPTEDNEVYSF